MARRKFKPNKKGQFTIIAAILVAIILIAAVMTTYSAIQYSGLQNDPQTQSTIDEVNLALKKVLGFTVGYYGSVLQVTGNTSYAKTLADNYIRSGLENTADLKADLGASFNATTLDLSTSWFSNTSYSSGNIAVQYNLASLGVYGLTYTTSSRLDVQILQSPNLNQACVSVIKDTDEPLINLGLRNFKFYEYAYSNSTWVYTYPESTPTAFTNGTYLIDIPSGVDPTAYILSVEDSRGIMVVASSFSRYTSTLAWNGTSVETDFLYVDSSNPVIGTQSNFATQQSIDGIFDSLAKYFYGTFTNNYHIDYRTLTTARDAGGSISDTYTSNNIRLQFRPLRYGSIIVVELGGDLDGEDALDNWQSLSWLTELSVSYGSAYCTIQLFNYDSNSYATSGDGYATATLTTTDQTISNTITSNPSYFRSSSGNWKLKITVYTTAYLRIDMIQYSPAISNYALDIRESWLSVNASNPRQDLCIKTGDFSSSESLLVDVWYGGTWINLMTLSANSWNNVSLLSYIDSANLTIRFRDGSIYSTPSSWNIDAVFLKNQPDISFIVGLQESTFTVEILQNGTMIWLGEEIQSSTNSMPIPPVSVKAIHVNMTINGVNQEVPFQIEDWAADYSIPLGLSNNATVFSNRQMIVILLNGNVTEFTIWWDGSDEAVQTAKAYTNIYFTSDDPDASTLSNGIVTLTFGSFTVTSTVATGVSSTATFMRINNDASEYGAGLAYVIHHGVVRDIIEQEAEWGSGGASNSPNLYANIVITLPANVTYYTYALHIMFISSSQIRTLTDLCPISITTTSLSSLQAQTENGTSSFDFPNVEYGTGTYYNYTTGSWTAHHWSQLITSSGSGCGLMFTDTANQILYAFSYLAGNTGALKADESTKKIELLPVTSAGSASFQTPLDITWTGAVVTFNSSRTPIYDTSTSSGLWILVEYPPTITQTAQN